MTAIAQNFIDLLDPLFAYRFDEASGDLINYGSVSGADISVPSVNVTRPVDGEVDDSSAYRIALDDNGAHQFSDIPYGAWASEHSFEVTLHLRKRYAVSENGFDRLFGTYAGPFLQFALEGDAVHLEAGVRNTSPDIFYSTSEALWTLDSDNDNNPWAVVSLLYDDAGSRFPHLYLNGYEVIYSTFPHYYGSSNINVPLTGTYQEPTAGITLFTNAGLDVPTHADVDALIWTRPLCDAERKALVLLLRNECD